MNNLFSASWRRDPPPSSGSPPAAPTAGTPDLEKFFEDAESIKNDLQEIARAHRSLHAAHASLKSQHSPAAIRDLRARADGDVAHALKTAKLVKLKLESLDRSNASSRFAAGTGPGTPADRTRTSVVAGLRTKLKEQMDAFGELRRRAAAENREAVARRYYTVTGERPDDATLDAMAAAEEEGEGIMRAAVAGRGAVDAAIAEMRERRGAAEKLEKSLVELHQVFLDMAVMVDAQGHQIDDIESQVGKASSFVDHGARQLHQARRHQKNTRKWACFGILLLLIIVLVIVLPIVLKN